MAANISGVLSNSLQENIKSSKVLVVGAGGIGCELIKNLILTGFEDIEIIDLDTIDVSNLNRQFLFQKQHVGKSKAIVAKEVSEKLNKNVNIKAYHDSITNSEYGVSFFKRFTIVMNALDNRNARSHVNRMCLAADVPLIESGSGGYLGQVWVIKKGLTECYDCVPKAAEKTYPGCTIRNTPSEPIHCIVWAKHLFNQLFGEADPDEDVSPDTGDPNAGEIQLSSFENNENSSGNVDRVSTRLWAKSNKYDPKKLFAKLFHDDINYLLLMDKLWKTRRPPVPLDLDNLPDAVASSSKIEIEMRDQQIWSINDCATVFTNSVTKLTEELESLKESDHLVWDKDNETAMDFVAACANIRAYIFGISQNSKFDIKSMAGNIIPAIATTNAIIAGLIVTESMKILNGRLKDCKMVYLNKKPHFKKKYLLAFNELVPPNPKCYVCSEKSEVVVTLNTKTFTVKGLEEKVLKGNLNMIAPDVEVEDGKGTILISSEEGETTSNNDKFLSDFGIKDGTRLKCDDFLQNFEIVINIANCERLENDAEFEVTGEVKPMPDDNKEPVANGKESNMEVDDDDDLILVNDSEDIIEDVHNKRKRELKKSESPTEPIAKRKRMDVL